MGSSLWFVLPDSECAWRAVSSAGRSADDLSFSWERLHPFLGPRWIERRSSGIDDAATPLACFLAALITVCLFAKPYHSESMQK
jgi:hypothetical protein